MQVKQFIAPTMRRALQLVRDDLGEDAVILSSRRNGQGIEVTAASAQPVAEPAMFAEPSVAARAESPRQDDDDGLPVPRGLVLPEPSLKDLFDLPPRTPRPAREVVRESVREAPAARLRPEPMADDRVAALQRQNAASERHMMELHAELRDMRKLLNSQLSGMAWGQFNNQQPHKAAVWRRLSRLGLQGQQVRAVCDLLDDLPDEATAWRHALAHLTHRVPVCRNDLIDGGGVFAFVGPTGVGKTTTIGKLAARYVLQHGPENVALITTDCFRIAGHEQLRVFGRILGVTVKVLSDPSELADTVRMLRRKSLILIDTAGLRQGIPGHDEQIAALQSLGDKVQNLLVLPATAQLSVLKASHYAYQAIGLSGCVITKLDECASLGEALSLVMEMQLPVTYVTDGQQVPGDISTARAPQLVSRAVSLARHASVDEDQLADTYSEQWSDRQREALAY